MYTTRRFNSKVGGPNEGYLTVGDAYDKPQSTDGRTKGRQFQTNPPKQGQQEGYFAKFEYVVDNYQDNNGYRITQPRASRKLGFGSYDANRRDEFTLDIRAQQYRELLDKERFFEGVYMGQNVARGGETAEQMAASAAAATQRSVPADSPHMFQTQVPTMLYDIGKVGGTTPICNKCSRETFYCKHRIGSGTDTLRRVGPHKTAAAVVGAEIMAAEKPQHGRKSHIKQFYDNNHLAVVSH